MGLRLDIFTSRHGSCSNGGVSSRCTTVTLVEFAGKPVRGPDEPSDESPAVRVVKRFVYGTEYLYAVPVELEDHTTAGGTFVWSTDSRFRELNEAPISFHDRTEG